MQTGLALAACVDVLVPLPHPNSSYRGPLVSNGSLCAFDLCPNTSQLQEYLLENFRNGLTKATAELLG